jgi:methyltransferase (TIGR00027 family)
MTPADPPGGASSASRTARMVATFRGRASAEHPGLCDDPWALALGGEDGAADARVYERAHPHMVLYMAVRTAFFDDAVRAAVADGIAQVVLLGAGLDTRAARLFPDERARFFEVDRPESQADKRARVAALGTYPAARATYVACDFERDDFLDRLLASGFDAAAPAVFVWEGVTYYLREETVRGTLARIASACHPRTRVLFDTVGKRFARGDVKDAELRARELVAEMGEPIAFGVDDLVPIAHACGYRHARSTTVDALCLSLTGTYERDRKMRFQSLHELRVEPPPRPR